MRHGGFPGVVYPAWGFWDQDTVMDDGSTNAEVTRCYRDATMEAH